MIFFTRKENFKQLESLSFLGLHTPDGKCNTRSSAECKDWD